MFFYFFILFLNIVFLTLLIKKYLKLWAIFKQRNPDNYIFDDFIEFIVINIFDSSDKNLILIKSERNDQRKYIKYTMIFAFIVIMCIPFMNISTLIFLIVNITQLV